MVRIIVQRFFIIGGLISLLIGLDLVSDHSLLLTLPDDIDVVQAILSKRDQLAELERLKNEALEDYYSQLLEEEQERIEAEEDRIQDELDRIQEEEDRIKAEQDALINAYTLGDRDKPLDYQILFDPAVKHTFIIDFDSTEWQGLIDDMELYNNLYGTYRSNNYRKVDVTYITEDETLEIMDVGIRSKGNIYSRYPPVDGNGDVIPIHYVLKFNETFDTLPGTDAYDLLKKREVFDLEKLAFKWNRNNDQTYLSEVYSMQVFRDAGVAAPNMALTKFVIRIDGQVEMEELYSVQEVIDEEFIRKHLQDVPTKEVGDLYKVVWPGTLEPIYDMNLVGVRDWISNTRPVYGLETNDDVPDYTQLIEFTRNLSMTNVTERRTYIENTIDIDMYLRAFAVSVLLGNPDDYRGNANNYYAYFDLNGVFHYLPYDFDHSLGQGWSGSPVFINYSLGNDIYIWEGNGFSSYTRNIPLIDNVLLEYEDYQIQYENYIEQFVTDGTFSYDTFNALFIMSNDLYGDEFFMTNDKAWFINGKITNVLDDIDYYRSLRD